MAAVRHYANALRDAGNRYKVKEASLKFNRTVWPQTVMSTPGIIIRHSDIILLSDAVDHRCPATKTSAGPCVVSVWTTDKYMKKSNLSFLSLPLTCRSFFKILN